MTTATLARALFDRWITADGPARAELLGPLWNVLKEPADPPEGFELCIEPLRHLLDQVRSGSVGLDKDFLLDPDYAAAINDQLGFTTPAMISDGRAWLEIDALHVLARRLRATVPGDHREQITRLGRALADDPLLLWDAAAAALGLHGPCG